MSYMAKEDFTAMATLENIKSILKKKDNNKDFKVG